MSNSDDNKDSGPRDPIWLRWAKFLSIIVVTGLVVGALFVFSIYIGALVDAFPSGRHYHHSVIASEALRRDNAYAIRVRFIVGACIGGALGLIYMIRCLIKRVDP